MSAHVLLNLLNELGKTIIVSFFYFLCFICCLNWSDFYLTYGETCKRKTVLFNTIINDRPQSHETGATCNEWSFKRVRVSKVSIPFQCGKVRMWEGVGRTYSSGHHCMHMLPTILRAVLCDTC